MEIISTIVLDVIDAFIILFVFTFVNQLDRFPRKNVIKSIIFVSLYVLILTFTGHIIPQGFRQLFNIIFLTILLGFITQTSLYAAAITNSLICIFLFTIEIVVSLILTLILGVDIETLLNMPVGYMAVGIVSKGLELLLALLIINSKITIKKLSEFKKPTPLLQLLALQTLMIIIIIICLNFVDAYKLNVVQYNVFIVTVYILFLILNLIDFKERERLQAIQNRFKVQDEYINNMENILTIIRREKHDFSNHLNTILAMCTLNKPDTVQKVGNYIRKLSVRLINAYHFYNTGNDYVDGMLAVKSNFAFEHGMHLEVDFQESLKSININDCDITSIIGNITDNAFDAIIAAGDSEGKTVSIRTYDEGYSYNLVISNNGPTISDKDMGRIFNSGYSTKSNEKSDHGFGLYIVKQLIERYNGTISVSSTEEKTEFMIKFIKDVKANGKAG